MNYRLTSILLIGLFLFTGCSFSATTLPTPTVPATDPLVFITTETPSPIPSVTTEVTVLTPADTPMPAVSANVCTDPQVITLIDSLKRAMLNNDGALLSSLVSPANGMEVRWVRYGNIITYTREFADLPPGSVCNGPIRALFSPDERHIAVFGYNDETGEAATRLLIISTHSGSTVRAVSDFTVLPRSPEFITFSSNSERLVWQLDHALAALSFDESPDALRVVPVPDNPECFQLRTDDGRHAWIIHGTYSAYGARRASVDIAAGTLTPDEGTEAPVCGIGSPAFVDQPSMLAATVPNVQGDLLTLPSERDAPRIMSSDGHYLVVDRWTGTHSYPTLYQYHPVLDGPYRASKIVDLVEDGGPALAAAFDRRGRLVAMYPNGMMVTRLLEDSDAASMQFALPTHSQEVWNGVGTAPNVPEGRLIARHSASGRSLVLNQTDRFGVVPPEATYWFDDVSNRIALAQNGLDFSPAGAFIVGQPLPPGGPQNK